MDLSLQAFGAIIFYTPIAYLVGSIPFGLLLTKIFIKKDIRDLGSGNIGATNVLRTGNKPLAFFTLLLDVAKGSAIVYLAMTTYSIDKFWFPPQHPLSIETVTTTVGLAAIFGHCFPVWLKFKGGKGVATTLGVLLAAVPIAGLSACGVWLLTALLFKISSFAALVAVLIAPVVTFFAYGKTPAVICSAITLLVWTRHKDNIKRLLKGEEPRIGEKKNKEEPVARKSK